MVIEQGVAKFYGKRSLVEKGNPKSEPDQAKAVGEESGVDYVMGGEIITVFEFVNEMGSGD